jgi:hypothetical protein
VRQALQDQLHGVGAVLERLAQIALRGPFHEAQVLHVQRLVEPEPAANVVDVLLSSVSRDQRAHGIAGKVDQGECEHAHRDQHKRRLEQAAYEIGGHGEASRS